MIAKHGILVVFLAMLLSAPSLAAELQAGSEAYKRGDYVAALKKVAEKGHKKAQYSLGVMYANGQDVPQNYAEAVRWFRLAAEQGYAHAQNNLGLMYKDDQGVTQDYAEAVRWFRLAAEQGNADAQHNLGLMYKDDQGVTQDYAKAVRWFRLAAEQAHARAQDNLGFMYENGQGVTRDYVQAHMWFNLTAAHLPLGEERDMAVRNRDKAAKLMTPDQIAEAQRLAREWQPK